MPCIDKLQIKPRRNMLAASRWHRLAKNESHIYGGCTPDFNLIHFPLATRTRTICFNVGKSEKRSFTGFWDGEWLAVAAGTTHHKMEQGWQMKWKLKVAFVTQALKRWPILLKECTWNPTLHRAQRGPVCNLWPLRNKLLTDTIWKSACQEHRCMN
jgi:hypothetical protein